MDFTEEYIKEVDCDCEYCQNVRYPFKVPKNRLKFIKKEVLRHLKIWKETPTRKKENNYKIIMGIHIHNF